MYKPDKDYKIDNYSYCNGTLKTIVSEEEMNNGVEPQFIDIKFTTLLKLCMKFAPEQFKGRYLRPR